MFFCDVCAPGRRFALGETGAASERQIAKLLGLQRKGPHSTRFRDDRMDNCV
jgi:hypothetical protein